MILNVIAEMHFPIDICAMQNCIIELNCNAITSLLCPWEGVLMNFKHFRGGLIGEAGL